jgi:general secretion pathway protein E
MPEPTSAPPEKKLGEILVDAALLTAERLEQAAEEAGRLQIGLLAYLLDEGMVSPEDAAMALSLEINLPIIDLKRHAVQPEALSLVPDEYARQHELIPIDVVGDALVVVMADPTNIDVLEDLRARAKKVIQPAVGIPADIREAIERSYRTSDEIDEQVGRVPPPAAEPQGEEALTPALASQAPIVRTVELLLAQAVRDRASDIHLEPKQDCLRVRYRIDGVLHEAQTLPLSFHPPLVSRLKVIAGMNIAERRRPQDGQFYVQIDGKEVDFRVASCDSAHGEVMVLRVLDKSLSLIALEDLGCLPESLGRYSQMLRTPFGMVLVGGPSGAGKTTTLYASVNELDQKERNTVTVEDPIEYHFDDVTQIQVNPRADITFGSGLRSIMRLDPDVILVGEVRDSETAGLATQAALTGHLVLSSIHANDAVGILFRLIDLGVEPFLVSSALVGVISQRLVRRVCSHCRALADVPPEEQAAYAEELGERPEQLYYGAGCNFCANTGYAGRTGVFEVLVLSEELRSLLLKGASSQEMKARAISEDMITMRRAGMLKVQEGITTPHEVIRNVFSIG